MIVGLVLKYFYPIVPCLLIILVLLLYEHVIFEVTRFMLYVYFSPYAEELEYNIDFLINHQDIRQCHFLGDQNRAEDRYEEEAYNPNEEGQHVFQSLSPD